MKKVLANEKNTSLFFDNWVPGLDHALISDVSASSMPSYILHWKVSDIFQNEQWHFREQAMIPIWNYILLQVVPVSDSVDRLEWNCSNNGAFSLKSAWELVCNSDPSFQFFSVIWFPSHSPKMAICLLRALQGKLLTRDFLTSLGIADTNICVLCHSAAKSIHHLFFECPFSAYLWSLYGLKLRISEPIGTLQNEAVLIQSRFKRKREISILAKLILSAVVWHILKEKNLRGFQLQSQHKIIVFWRLYEDIRLLMRTCHWKTGRQKKQLEVLSNWNIQFS